MKKKKYLPLYRKWMKTGLMPEHGLCDSIQYSINYKARQDFVDTFQPAKGYLGLWGYDGNNYIGYELMPEQYERIAYKFNPLRQNMLLLFAAMNNEL